MILRRTKQSKTGCIPAEIVTKILQLLPMESILSCKRVSKQWRNLVNDPDFYKHYLPGSSISFTRCGDSFYCLLIRSNARKISGTITGDDHPPFTMHRLPTDSIEFQDPQLASKYPSSSRLTIESYLGSSGGVVCILYNDWTFGCYDLFTGDSFKVEDAPLRQNAALVSPNSNWLFFSFGYNRYADDYKIMVVDAQSKDDSLYWVYSFKDSVWKPLGGFPCVPYYWSRIVPQACAFNGILHWATLMPKDEKKVAFVVVIVTYDLHTCKFGEMSVSSDNCNFTLDYWPTPVLAGLDGKICCWIARPGKATYVLLVMEEYGVPESWTTLISVDSREIAAFDNWYSRDLKVPMMLYQCRDGKKRVLFVTRKEGSLYWYNVDTGKVSPIHPTRWKKRRMKQPILLN